MLIIQQNYSVPVKNVDFYGTHFQEIYIKVLDVQNAICLKARK